MNIFEEAVIFSTVMHTGMTRKQNNAPYILHPLEVSQIIATMTDDIEVITAGVLHDVVEDTDGTIDEIRNRFGDRVANIVSSETENKYPNEDASDTWERRKKESLKALENSTDIGVKILWLADKLSNIRSIAGDFSSKGAKIWDAFHQKDPAKHKWYYQSVGELVEIDLNKTGAFKEYVLLINSIWPGTFHIEKSKYKKYREISIDGCKAIGKGAKGAVYRYNDEVIVKVYNENNLFKDIERENYLARKAFVAGIPTAISFGIVSIGNKYGSMFELLNSDSISNLISKNPENVKYYAKAMADLARLIHGTRGEDIDLPDYTETVHEWVNTGLIYEDKALAQKLHQMIDALPKVNTIIHGDFHTGNVMEEKGELLLIDMDRLSICHPIVELSGIYQFYNTMGEINPKRIEDFMGFSYETAKLFCDYFFKHYFKDKPKSELEKALDSAALLSYVRLVRGCHKEGNDMSSDNRHDCDFYMEKIKQLLEKTESLL